MSDTTISEIRVPQAVAGFIDEVLSGKIDIPMKSLEDFVALCSKIYESRIGALNKILKRWREAHERYSLIELIEYVNKKIQFYPVNDTIVRFHSYWNKSSAPKSLKKLLVDNDIIKKRNKHGWDIGFSYTINKDAIKPSDYGRTIKKMFESAYIDVRDKFNEISKNLEMKLQKSLLPPLKSVKNIRLDFEKAKKEDIDKVMKGKAQKAAYNLSIDNVKLRTSFFAKRQFSELSMLPKVVRKWLFDVTTGEYLTEVDFHAIQPIIMLHELKRFYDAPKKWCTAQQNHKIYLDTDKGMIVSLKELFHYLSTGTLIKLDEQWRCIGDYDSKFKQKLDTFLKHHLTLAKKCKKILTSPEIDNLEGVFIQHIEGLFGHNVAFHKFNIDHVETFDQSLHGDFYEESSARLFDGNENACPCRSEYKICILRLMHGKAWNGEKYYLSDDKTEKSEPNGNKKGGGKGESIDQYMKRKDEESDAEWELKTVEKNVSTEVWQNFITAVIERYPLALIAIFYLQRFVAVLDQGKYSDDKKHKEFCRLLFNKEAMVMKDIQMVLNSNSVNSSKISKKVFSSIGIKKWNSKQISFFPIFDCFVVAPQYKRIVFRVMNTVASEIHGYRYLRATFGTEWKEKPSSSLLIENENKVERKRKSSLKVKAEKTLESQLQKALEALSGGDKESVQIYYPKMGADNFGRKGFRLTKGKKGRKTPEEVKANIKELWENVQ